MTTTTPLFEELVSSTDAYIDRRGQAHIDCPACGKEVKRGQHHFSFSDKGGHCFVCGYSAGLRQIAEQLGTPTYEPAAEMPRSYTRTAQKPRNWQSRPDMYLDQFCASWDRLERWQAYKPLALETIARWRLGVGVLPSSPCQHRRLIYPIFEAGKIAGFRGRAIDCACDKWISAGGSTARLWGIDLLRPGALLIVCENPVDSMLAMQEEPRAIVVAGTAGAATWRSEWTQAIAQSRPRQVIVWMDNDLAGQPNAATYRSDLARWRAEMQHRMEVGKIKRLPQAPEPNGPKIANEMASAGVPVSLYAWPASTPAKADLGWALSQKQKTA